MYCSHTSIKELYKCSQVRVHISPILRGTDCANFSKTSSLLVVQFPVHNFFSVLSLPPRIMIIFWYHGPPYMRREERKTARAHLLSPPLRTQGGLLVGFRCKLARLFSCSRSRCCFGRLALWPFGMPCPFENRDSGVSGLRPESVGRIVSPGPVHLIVEDWKFV
jgi:hypothetical protein